MPLHSDTTNSMTSSTAHGMQSVLAPAIGMYVPAGHATHASASVEKNISDWQTMASHDIEPSLTVAVCEGHTVHLADFGEGLIWPKGQGWQISRSGSMSEPHSSSLANVPAGQGSQARVVELYRACPSGHRSRRSDRRPTLSTGSYAVVFFAIQLICLNQVRA